MNRMHKIELAGLFAGSGRNLVVEEEIALDGFEGINFPQPARTQLNLRVLDRLIAIEGAIDIRAQGECVGCLDDVERDLHVEVSERLDPNGDRDTDPFAETNVLSGTRLDLDDLVQQLVVTALPMGLRCSQECRGLCGECGANLNAGDCPHSNGESRGKSQMEDASQ